MSITRRIGQLERCDPEMFGDLIVTCQTPYLQGVVKTQAIKPVPYTMCLKKVGAIVRPPVEKETSEGEKRRASILVDELLLEIYCAMNGGCSGYNSTSGKSCRSTWVEAANLEDKGIQELERAADRLRLQLGRMCDVLVRRLKRRDALRLQQETFCDVINERLFLIGEAKNNLTDMRFTIQPLPGDTGFSQWVAAMKMVAQLQGGIPSEFRKRLWLTMADKHLAAKGVDWPKVERTCFSEWSHPADAELGVQIVKDLHRTGCSLFCGKDGQENQVLLKRVLLAYARWNKSVGYCQGFNMLAALILQVTDKCESEALKLMIYLIEGVLPDSYFADSLRGLSVDMAAFRELLRTKLPKLSKHLDRLQTAAKDGNRSYEPPLTNVFTMQWFLTLFCNCLPQPTVLRVWDLIFLEGNEILLRTALAIWQVLEEKILGARSADEFYCLMGALTREILEFDLIDANSLVKAVVVIGPLTELDNLREHYLYNINPWGKSLSPVVDKQLKVYSKQSMALDISALKKQYDKLKQRQRQAHIIFSAAITRQPPPAPPVTINHLLLGKSALVPAKRLGPVRGSIPPPAQPPQPPPLPRQAPSTLHWKDAQKNSSSSSSSDTELCDEDTASSSDDEPEQTRFDDNLRINVVDTTATDNTPSAKSSAEVELDVASQTDSSDFEQFLADRVKYLGSPTEEAAEEKINYARRNSERALQIIQENSMILHRIMQCQSRFSPSPPLDDKAGSCSYSTKEIDTTITTTIPIESEELSPYKSKYTSILEKSKSLDEKYNALILNVQQKQPLLGALKNKSDSALPKFSLGPTDESAESNKSFKYVDSDADINSQQGCDTSIREFKYKIDDSKYLHLENYPTPTSFSYENTDTIISPECDEKYRLPIKEFEKFYTISPEGSIQSPGNTEANPSHFSFETEQTQFESDFTSKNSPTEKSIEIPLSPQEILKFSTKRSNFNFTTKEVSLFASQHSPYESSQSSAPSYETEKVSEFNYNFDVSPITTSEYNHEQFSPKSTQNSPSNPVTSNFKFIHTDALFSDNPSYSLEELAKELVSPGVEDLDLVSQNLPFRSIFEEERELSPKDQPLPFSIETSEQNVSSIEEQSPTTFMKEHSQKFVPPQSLTVDSYDFPSSSGDSDYFSNRSPSKLVSSLESVQSPPLSLTTRSNFLYDLPCSSIDTSRRFVSSFETTSPPSESKLDPSASYGDSMDKKLLMKTRSLSPSTLVRVEGGSPSPVDARTCYNFPEERLKPLNLAPFSISPLKSLKSPSRSPAKSPDQPFNPFPVAISTRQNKEVPLKLGMYKK